MIFFQLYPRFTRFECKVFLTEALAYFGGAAARCMIDNTHVVVLKGTGADMVPVPEMAAFAERFGFDFAAHEMGDANRSARVEGPFDYIENNFLAGREFRDWDDLNARRAPGATRATPGLQPQLHASRRELFAAEQPALKPLPICVPEVYQLHHRIVDVEGYVNVRAQPLLGAVPAHRPPGRGARDEGPDRRLRRAARWWRPTGACIEPARRARHRSRAPPAARPGPAPRRAQPPEETGAARGRAQPWPPTSPP